VADQDDDLMQKADALMRRRRIFLAGGANDADGAKELAAAEDADDDIPLLTDVVSPDVASSPHSNVDVAALRRALAAEIESWLDRDLPSQVQHVLDGITDQLILQLSAQARSELLPRLQDILSAAQEGAKQPPAED
jgi:hypothetical protein